MANLLIGWADWSDEAVIDEVSSEVSGFPASQLQTPQPSDYWEAAGGNVVLVLDRGSEQAFNVVSLLYTNAPADTVWRIRAANTKAELTKLSTIVDTGYVPFRVPGDDDTWDNHHGLRYVEGGAVARWLRIDIAIGATLDTNMVGQQYSLAGGGTTFEAGRLVVGNLFQPNVNDSYGRGLGVSDPNVAQRTDGGALFSDNRAPFLTATLVLDFMSRAEAFIEAHALLRRRGSRQDVLYVADPADPTYLRQGLIYGRMTRLLPITLPDIDRYQLRLSLEEML